MKPPPKRSEPSFSGRGDRRLGLLLSEDEQRDALHTMVEEDLNRFAQLKTVDVDRLKDAWSSTADMHEALRALCEEYGIPEDKHCFYWLAMSLARQFLKPTAGRGAKGKWALDDCVRLVIDADVLYERFDSEMRRGSKHDWVFGELADREPYKSKLQFKNAGRKLNDPSAALKKQYDKSKADAEIEAICQIFRRLFSSSDGISLSRK